MALYQMLVLYIIKKRLLRGNDMINNSLDANGYSVSEKRRAVWNIEIELLKCFINACEENGLKYFLIGGTAIGAVRHKGFIPWDDDFDIGMLRDDFEKFLEVADQYFGGNSVVQYGVQKDCVATFMRIRDVNSTAIIRNQKNMKINHGVFIEIYPFDKVPVNRLIRKIQWKISASFIDVLQKRYKEKHLGPIAKIINRFYVNKSTPEVFHAWNKVCTFFNKYHMNKVDTVSIPIYSASEVDFYDEKDVIQTKMTEFEDFEVRIPIGNDRCLRKTYGDYMKLPPVEERGMHHSRDIFYDPYHPYTYYIRKNEIIDAFFSGENDYGLL